MPTFYNDIDRYCCDWVSNLMDAGLITPGEICDTPVQNLDPGRLRGFDRVHLFCGIAGWDLSLRLADWPDDRPVWTASCPCQGFSLAGKQLGFEDPRHLWPYVVPLLAECAPPTLFGEQVASAFDWLHLVRSDLEALDYAMAGMPIEAASAGADHFRDRYWFVAHANSARQSQPERSVSYQRRWPVDSSEENRDRIVANAKREGLERATGSGEPSARRPSVVTTGISSSDGFGSLAHADSERPQVALSQSGDTRPECQTAAGYPVRGVEYDQSVGWGEGWSESELRSRGFTATVASIEGSQYIECPDGKWRRLPPPRVRWLGTRIPSRVDKLRAIGNSIDPRCASTFIKAFLDAEKDLTP